VIGGFTEPEGSRTGLGALLLGVHDGQGRRVEDPDALERLRQALEQALVQPL